jgi:hypothetical protein
MSAASLFGLSGAPTVGAMGGRTLELHKSVSSPYEFQSTIYHSMNFRGLRVLRMSFRDVLQIKVTSQCVLNAKRICL